MFGYHVITVGKELSCVFIVPYVLNIVQVIRTRSIFFGKEFAKLYKIILWKTRCKGF